MENGITITHKLNLRPLIMQGDSTLATQIGKNLQQGIEVAKVSDN